ncbi:VTC domain-containing protein, partial [bacterium]|nr:VTC domain-containing protein [bacterium]MBU1917098.1 VTC domain-containing protein [bacterium]
SNKAKTIKKRAKQNEFTTEINRELKDKTQKFLNKNSSFNIETIEPKLWVTFTRLTLANLERKERLTFDVDITYTSLEDNEVYLSEIAIAELKQPSLSLRSPFAQTAKKERIYPSKFSKYCTGVTLLHDLIKKGRFKRRLMYLDKISGGHRCFSKI